MKISHYPVRICLLSVVLALGTRDPCHGQTFTGAVVPNLNGAEGNSAGNYPFDGVLGSMRYQQVFDASQFFAISNGGGFISAIGFRADGPCHQDLVQTDPSLQVNLSTTSKRPDSLSPVFAENVGPDEATAHAAGSVLLYAGCAPNTIPQPFTAFISFEHPFFYDPRAGNLLLDIRNFSGPSISGSQIVLDGERTVGDSVSRIVAFDVNATVAQQIDSFGLVTEFVIQVPEPSTWALLALGLSGIIFAMSRQRRKEANASDRCAWPARKRPTSR